MWNKDVGDMLRKKLLMTMKRKKWNAHIKAYSVAVIIKGIEISI